MKLKSNSAKWRWLLVFVLSLTVVPVRGESATSIGDEACAKCHAAIVAAYRDSAMANASGPASQNVMTGELHHEKSGVNYKIESRDGHVWLHYDRPADPLVHGRRELLYYIGQGRRGRTYLFAKDGFLFESPINWYADRKLWDLAPGYTNASEIPMNLPALPSCLECHTSNFRTPIAGTENRYDLPLFTGTGISCERCHGPSTAHISSGGKMINPAKLPPDRRDQVCMQCHLEGDAAIERAGKHLYDYRLGDDLSQYIRYYVMADTHGSSLRAASQFEALAQSACKKESGDKLWCGSCHDPHRSIGREERVAYYRSKCLTCHGESFATKHHADNPDCTACHMPASQSKDVAHTAVTDHRILRRPTPLTKQPMTELPKLVPFPYSADADNDARDKGLAWQALVNSGMTDAEPEAERWLRKAAAQSADPAVLSALGYIDQKRNALDEAHEFYRKALSLDPASIETENNLGFLELRRGNSRDAISLWEDAFRRSPGRSTIGLNLARAFCSGGQFAVARRFTERVLQFNPDLGPGKQLLRGLSATPAKCVP